MERLRKEGNSPLRAAVTALAAPVQAATAFCCCHATTKAC